MLRRRSYVLCALLCVLAGGARADGRLDEGHRFAIVGHGFTDGGEKRLRQALHDNDDDTVAFLVVTGVKGANEPCTDKLYQKRRELIDEAFRRARALLEQRRADLEAGAQLLLERETLTPEDFPALAGAPAP